ncbi:MAG: preprotein translocase subunit SecE [Candidatus Omnitrophica bacterium]|nr:preprotein translocase subunit SecE [Candidatus Omnitrophota bacterium]MBU4140437.1 preprotein translocase subunit SecE [Candidatus Omnitrophota bacterium]
MLNKPVRFLSEVRTELKKVSWSTKKELISSTGVVIFTVSLLALFIGVIDFIISRAVNLVIR